MTVLAASQAAIARLVGRRPNAVVSSQGEMEVEITALAQEAAVDIMKGHDWQALTSLATIVGMGEDGHPLPADYDRMVQAMGVSSPSWPDWWFQQAATLDQWEEIKTRGFNLDPGWWVILGGRFMTLPALAEGQQARFYYISRNVFTAANGVPKEAIERDDDDFRLDDRLLTLSLIWRWKQMKQMDYAEDLRLYEDALSQEMARDGGAKKIARNGVTRFPGAVAAWPWTLG